jgi:hypothetical protein
VTIGHKLFPKMKPRSENPKDEGPFAWQTREAAVEAGKLGINAYAIYCALTHFQSMAGTDQKCRFAASYEQLASHIGASKNTVSRCLPDLQKAGLIRIFSGANGGLRATRNAFCLLSISHPSQGHGHPSQGHDVKPSQGWHVKPSQVCKKRTENKYKPGPQAPGVVLENEKAQPTCSPLRGGSGPQRTKQTQPPSTEDVPEWILLRNAMYEESERIIAEKKMLEDQTNS